jgi:uncharacterized protein (TIGR02231 family)
MKHKLLLPSLMLLLPIFSANAADIELGGKVSAVTLFTRGAEITRSARTAIASGQHTLIFRGIPEGVASDSLRASGSGAVAVRIQGVELRTRARREDVSATTEALKKKQESLQRSIETQKQTKTRLEREQGMLLKVQLDGPVPDGEQIVRPRSAQELTALLQFISQNGGRLQDEIRIVDEKLADLHKDLAVNAAELQKMAPGSTTESVVEVSVVAEAAGDVDVGITYQVNNASWSPTYNLLVGSGSGAPTFTVETYAVIQQRTGEDWDKVKLLLSTARPHLGLARPVPSARVLDVFTPIVRPPVAMRQTLEKARGFASNDAGALMEASAEAAVAGGPAQDLTFEETDAEISTGSVVTYTLPTVVSVKSDGSSEKVRVRSAALTGTAVNLAVPAYSTQAYREAIISNAPDAPLLAGLVSIFSNGSFVGRQRFGYTPAGKEMKLPIGISDDVSVTRKLAEKFEDDSGLVRSVRRIRYVYQIETENHSAAAQRIVVLEPAPVSRNEKIKVELNKVEPKSMDVADAARVQADGGILEWQLTIPAKQKQIISYEFTVEFEASLQVTGLEGL